jgi:hypothetical protein
MWRLWVSGLFCLPAMVIMFHQRSDDSAPGGHMISSPPTNVVASNASRTTMHLSLPPVELLSERALPDPPKRNVTGPSVAIPLQDVMSQLSTVVPPDGITTPRPMAGSAIALRHRPASHSSHRSAGLASRVDHRDGPTNTLIAFITRNLTRRAFALPDQNGGG